MDDKLKNEILSNIQLEGASLSENKPINLVIADNEAMFQIVDYHSGQPRIRPSLVSNFKFTVVQPSELESLNPLIIRCCFCRKVISYPAWHYNVKLIKNWFHYFVCFDSNSINRVTTRCLLKRS